MKMLSLESLRSARIVCSGNASAAEHFAAEELQKHLRRMTGIDVFLADHASADCFAFELGVADSPEVRFDGFRWDVSGNRLRISANLPRGVLNGVYTLLEFWGCRWFFQRENGVIPRLKELPLPESKKINPDLELRGVCIFPVNRENLEHLRTIIDWLGKNRFNLLMTSINRTKKRDNGWEVEWLQVEDELLPELQKRGMILNISEHSGRYFFPTSYFETHPEWFAMNASGKRFSTGQICYSNTEAIDTLVQNFVEYAAKHPEVEILGTWPEDGYGFCKCEHCVKPGTVLKAVNRIADAIKTVRPDLTVEYLSYTSETSDVPPEILPRDNMSILVANMRVAKEWKKKTDAVGGRGVYRLHYHLTDNTAERANLPIQMHRTLTDCRECFEGNVRGIIPFFIGIDTWWRSSLNLYFLTRFSWNTRLEVEDVLSDLCGKWFGSAGEAMEKLFLRLEKIPMVDQHRPPRWPLWQEWESMKTEFSGAKWEETLGVFESLRGDLMSAEKSADVPKERFRPIGVFIEFQKTMFLAWHNRALAVAEFEKGNAAGVREHLVQTAKYERILEDQVRNAPPEIGVAGGWIDYAFFQNWRLQLDKQLMEMRTPETMIPVTDDNPDVELFLPGLLDN